MLSCKDVTERADAWLDGDLSPLQAMQVRLHLAMCKGCSRFMGQMRTTRLLTERTTSSDAAQPLQEADDARISDILSQLQEKDQNGG